MFSGSSNLPRNNYFELITLDLNQIHHSHLFGTYCGGKYKLKLTQFSRAGPGTELGKLAGLNFCTLARSNNSG